MNEIISLVKGKEANGMPLAAAVAMAVLFIFCGITEYMHLQIVAQGVRDAVQEAVIAAVNDNYDDVYHGVREGYAGGYYPASGEGWEESLDYGDIYGRLDDLLGLSDEGNWHVKYLSGGEMEYRLSGLKTEIINVPFASNVNRRFLADAYVKLEVPVRFGGKMLPDMKIQLKVRAGYTPKF